MLQNKLNNANGNHDARLSLRLVVYTDQSVFWVHTQTARFVKLYVKKATSVLGAMNNAESQNVFWFSYSLQRNTPVYNKARSSTKYNKITSGND